MAIKINEVWVYTPQSDKYMVSSYGRVKRLVLKGKNNVRILSLKNHNGGYKTISLFYEGKQHGFLVHRLVMEAFKGASKLPVDHLDSNKHNNYLSNLEYVTDKENQVRSSVRGTIARGERVHNSKLTEDNIKFIRGTLKNEIRGDRTRLASMFGVSQSCITCIGNNNSWSHV